jgi:hypothetical protein
VTNTERMAQPEAQRLTPTEARQGRPGRPVLYVLVAGLILAAIAAGVIMLGSKATDQVPNQTTKGVSSITAVDRVA